MKTSTKLLIAIWTPILLGATIFFGYCAIGAVKDMNNPDAWKKYQSNHTAVSMAEDFVREELKYPADAIFCDYEKCQISYIEDEHSYLIKGTVDSKNGFGAYVPMTYFAEVQQVSAKEWKLVDLNIKEKK